jgi:hypothetical protein
MRWAGYIALMGVKRMHRGLWWERQKERDNLEEPDVGGKILHEVLGRTNRQLSFDATRPA